MEIHFWNGESAILFVSIFEQTVEIEQHKNWERDIVSEWNNTHLPVLVNSEL